MEYCNRFLFFFFFLLAKFGTHYILFMVVEILAGIPLPNSIKVKSNHQVYEPT